MDASIIQSARHCTFFSIVVVGVYLYEDPPSLWKVRDISTYIVLVGYPVGIKPRKISQKMALSPGRMARFVLEYNYVPNILELRAPFREQHLEKANALVNAGVIIAGFDESVMHRPFIVFKFFTPYSCLPFSIVAF